MNALTWLGVASATMVSRRCAWTLHTGMSCPLLRLTRLLVNMRSSTLDSRPRCTKKLSDALPKTAARSGCFDFMSVPLRLAGWVAGSLVRLERTTKTYHPSVRPSVILLRRSRFDMSSGFKRRGRRTWPCGHVMYHVTRGLCCRFPASRSRGIHRAAFDARARTTLKQ